MVGTGSTPGIGTLVDALGQSAGLKIKKVAGAVRRVRRQRSRVILQQGCSRPVCVHGAARRLPSAQRRFGPHQLHRDGPHRRLSRADHARRRPAARAADVSSSSPRQAAARTRGGDTARRGTSVSLGIMPDYAYEKKDGLRITGVRDGGPADKAGLKDGDRIVRCG